MKDAITDEFGRLVTDIRRFESVRNMRDDSEEHIKRALVWLRERQHPDGYWGEKCLLDTQMVLLALGLWEKDIQHWSLPNDHQGGIELAFIWLEKFQANDAWDNNIWETAAIIQTAAAHGIADRQSIRRAQTWLEAREFDNWGLDKNYGPHYIAQAISAMVMVGSPPRLIAKARTALLNKINELNDAGKPLAPYIAGQIVDALILAGVNPMEDEVSQITNYLQEYLLSAEVTIANWLHLCLAFRGVGLAIGNAGLEQPAIQLSIQRLFSPNRIREDGSWYHDVTLTAFGLTALNSIQSVRKIEVYSYEIFTSLYHSKTQILRTVQKEGRQRLIFFLYGCAIPMLFAGIIYLAQRFLSTEREVLTNSDFIFFLIPLFVSAIAFILVRIVRFSLREMLTTN